MTTNSSSLSHPMKRYDIFSVTQITYHRFGGMRGEQSYGIHDETQRQIVCRNRLGGGEAKIKTLLFAYF